MQDTALAYLDKRAATDVAFWAMVATPVASLHSRADAVVAAIAQEHPSAAAVAMDSLPGAGSAPGVTMPSYGVEVAGDLLASLRRHEPPVIARCTRGPHHARPAIGVSHRRRSDRQCTARRRYRRTVTVIATAGHVDHGKSSLVLALTGTDPDRLAEEKQRGLTIDLGFAHTTLPSGAELSFVDVPGHVRFLRNMLAGVGGVNACVFVVAATEGWKPQSEEHLRIVELLGCRRASSCSPRSTSSMTTSRSWRTWMWPTTSRGRSWQMRRSSQCPPPREWGSTSCATNSTR